MSAGHGMSFRSSGAADTLLGRGVASVELVLCQQAIVIYENHRQLSPKASARTALVRNGGDDEVCVVGART